MVPKPREYLVYIMQFLHLVQSIMLTFNDRGANMHLVDGALVDREREVYWGLDQPNPHKDSGWEGAQHGLWILQDSAGSHDRQRLFINVMPGS